VLGFLISNKENMRKLVLKMSVSVDGFIGGPKGEIDWILNTMDKEVVSWIQDTISQAGVHIMGSRTFHDMIAYWPTSSDLLAAPMNDIPKVVFSKKGYVESLDSNLTTQALKDAYRIDSEKGITKSDLTKNFSSWTNALIANGDLVEEITHLKRQDGKPILAHGGASFAQSLVKYNLIDEYKLVIHPVVLGHGLPLFSTLIKPLNFGLVNSTSFACGTIANTYRPI
jgi:dihydrofolate reductase